MDSLEGYVQSGYTTFEIIHGFHGGQVLRNYVHSMLKVDAQGFEYRKGLLSGKDYEIDHVLMNQCIDFCSNYKEPLIVLLMVGDVDYISMVETLANNGHEIRIFCINKQRISKQRQNL